MRSECTIRKNRLKQRDEDAHTWRGVLLCKTGRLRYGRTQPGLYFKYFSEKLKGFFVRHARNSCKNHPCTQGRGTKYRKFFSLEKGCSAATFLDSSALSCLFETAVLLCLYRFWLFLKSCGLIFSMGNRDESQSVPRHSCRDVRDIP